MSALDKPASRKKFMFWGLAAMGTALLLKVLPKHKKQESATVKMLTQDGKLVEIDRKLLASTGSKVSNEELKKWLNK
jgi:hypothetical protein